MSTPPIELMAPTPRRVGLRPLAYVFVLLAFAVSVGIPAVMVVHATRAADFEQILDSRGVIATGRVLSKSDARPKEGAPRRYQMDYEYMVPGSSQRFHGSDDVEQQKYDLVSAGDTVDVIFDPANPSESKSSTQIEEPSKAVK